KKKKKKKKKKKIKRSKQPHFRNDMVQAVAESQSALFFISDAIGKLRPHPDTYPICEKIIDYVPIFMFFEVDLSHNRRITKNGINTLLEAASAENLQQKKKKGEDSISPSAIDKIELIIMLIHTHTKKNLLFFFCFVLVFIFCFLILPENCHTLRLFADSSTFVHKTLFQKNKIFFVFSLWFFVLLINKRGWIFHKKSICLSLLFPNVNVIFPKKNKHLFLIKIMTATILFSFLKESFLQFLTGSKKQKKCRYRDAKGQAKLTYSGVIIVDTDKEIITGNGEVIDFSFWKCCHLYYNYIYLFFSICIIQWPLILLIDKIKDNITFKNLLT
ncbi:hypothetical protein RFI_24292, partial [Reticulomyxa filosa]